MGWHEIEHTADWAIVVDAPNRVALFLEAARAMYALAGCELGEGDVRETIEVDGPDDEALLVGFLGELLFRLDVRHQAFAEIALELDGEHLRAELRGAPVTRIVKTIKAVTFHDLQIRETPDGVETTIVFDV